MSGDDFDAEMNDLHRLAGDVLTALTRLPNQAAIDRTWEMLGWRGEPIRRRPMITRWLTFGRRRRYPREIFGPLAKFGHPPTGRGPGAP